MTRSDVLADVKWLEVSASIPEHDTKLLVRHGMTLTSPFWAFLPCTQDDWLGRQRLDVKTA